MHYCSKCGVYISETEDTCPLCGTQIVSGQGGKSRAYPADRQSVPMRSPNTAITGLMYLLLPALCCLAIDFLEDGLISWALYIVGAETCLFTYVFLPKLLSRPKASYCIAASSVATVCYFYLIGYLSGSAELVLPMAIPMTALSGANIFAILSIAKIKKVSHLFKAAVIISILGFFVMTVEAVIDVNLMGALTFGWALPVLLPIVCISAAMFYIEYDSELKSRLQRAVFLALEI